MRCNVQEARRLACQGAGTTGTDCPRIGTCTHTRTLPRSHLVITWLLSQLALTAYASAHVHTHAHTPALTWLELTVQAVTGSLN